jgi:hypothetical protein
MIETPTEGEMRYPPFNKATMLKRIVIVSVVSIFLILIYSCGQKDQGQEKELILKEMQLLIQKGDFEAARLAAIDALDPDIRMLYYDADKQLGHASHLDVRCNERIEELLYEIVKKVPAKSIKMNRDIYSELATLSPENKLYRKKFIYYDRKARGMIN